MDFSEIIKQSEKRLNKLRVITNFFDNADMIGISIRTRVIHDVFTSNPSLDVMKLELFHLQYTDTFLQLMQQLKKKTEQKYLLIQNEIKINSDFVVNYQTEIKKDSFREDTIKCNVATQHFFETAYGFLAFDTAQNVDDALVLREFSQQYASEYFRPLSEAQFQALDKATIGLAHVYKDILIEKKLLGKLNIHRFKVKFLCGFQHNHQRFSVFEFIHSNEHFMFSHQKNQFQLLYLKEFAALEFSKNSSNKQELIKSLLKKIKNLEQQATTSLKQIPNEVQLVVIEYYNKISSISFLDDLQNVDEQTNILKTMLNLNIK